MAHFAKLDNNNIVLNVLVVPNSAIVENDIENEEKGVEYLTKLTGYSKWKQTSYNTRKNKHYKEDNATLSEDQSKAFRGNFAQIGGTYDEVNNLFFPAKPYNSWIKNIETASWDPPIPEPELPETGVNAWIEENQTWEYIN